MGLIDRILKDDEEGQTQIPESSSVNVKHDVFGKKDFLIAFVIFALAVAARIIFLYKVADPVNVGDGWYGDTYHHWQIAYLTEQIGLSKGFLRLWDLKGMEYFWGPIHPILTILMFKITGSTSIVLTRILSIFFGSLSLSLIFLLGKKYWNAWVGVSAAFLAIINPVVIFNDASGMLEPIGLAFLLMAILLISTRPFLSGLMLSLALMVRAEAWLFSILILVLVSRFHRKSAEFMKLFLGFLIPTILYMKYLLDYTGNAIYPLWWNYLANARGVWAGDLDPTFSTYQLMVRPFLIGWFVISLIFFLIVFWRKPKGGILLSFGFSSWAFFGGFFGLTHYLKGFEPWFWYIRFFVFPYIFLGLILSILVFHELPKVHKTLKHHLVSFSLFLPIFIFAASIQTYWTPILQEYKRTMPTWERTKYWGEITGKYYNGGKVLISEGYPSYTYALHAYGGIEGKNIVGQMFDPFYYMDAAPFDNWGENREIILSWLKKEDIRLIVTDGREIRIGESFVNNARYIELIKREPLYFEKVGFLPVSRNSSEEILQIYSVKNDIIGSEI